jgi:chromosome partitioning protein
MKVISSVGAKGGSGKSSVSLLLAWELAQDHKNKVALLDADIQGTCISAKVLNNTMPFAVYSVTNKTELWQRGKQLAEDGYDYLIIDGNPRSLHEDPDLIEVIAKLSDLSLIISRPSPRDLKAQINYVNLVKKVTTGKIKLLWNFFQKNTSAHKDGISEGEKLLSLESLKTTIGLRVAYQDIGYTEGYIGDLGNKEAAQEIKALGNEIKREIHGT